MVSPQRALQILSMCQNAASEGRRQYLDRMNGVLEREPGALVAQSGWQLGGDVLALITAWL